MVFLLSMACRGQRLGVCQHVANGIVSHLGQKMNVIGHLLTNDQAILGQPKASRRDWVNGRKDDPEAIPYGRPLF